MANEFKQHDFKKFPELTTNQMNMHYFQSPHKQIIEDFEARVIKVTDGDTIRVETNFRNFDFPVRFSNIMAPETKEKGGRESHRWLEKRLLRKRVDILIDPKRRVGKWGRLLGRVMESGFDVGEESVLNGHSKNIGDFREGEISDKIGNFMEDLNGIKL